MLKEFQALFIRDLEKIKTELMAYRDENNIWTTKGDIKNSAGNLCLHVIGNLKHFIGSVILDTGYVRDREAEFNDKDVPLNTLIDQVDNTIELFRQKFLEIEPGVLGNSFPIQVFGYEMTTAYFITHLYGHLNYHLGQINYHRRLVDFK